MTEITNAWVKFVDEFFPQVAKDFPVPTDSSSENLEAIENAIKSAIKSATETATNIQQSNKNPEIVLPSPNIVDQSAAAAIEKTKPDPPNQQPNTPTTEPPSQTIAENLEKSVAAAQLLQISTMESSLEKSIKSLLEISIENAKALQEKMSSKSDSPSTLPSEMPSKSAPNSDDTKCPSKKYPMEFFTDENIDCNQEKRKISSKLHPDKNPECSKDATQKFQSFENLYEKKCKSNDNSESDQYLENAKTWIEAYLGRDKPLVIEEDKNTKIMREHIAKCFDTAIENAKDLIQHVNKGPGTRTVTVPVTGKVDGKVDGDGDGTVKNTVDGKVTGKNTGDVTVPVTGNGNGDGKDKDKHQWSGQDVRFTNTRSTPGNPSTTSMGVFQIKSKNGNHILEEMT